MAMPAGAVGRRLVGLHEMRNDLAAGGVGDAEIAIEEKIAQAGGTIEVLK